MRTFLSHDPTTRWFDCGEKAISDTLSSGGETSGASFEMSPMVWLAAAAALVPVVLLAPNKLDIVISSSPLVFCCFSALVGCCLSS